MTAPDTNLARQQRRHRWPLLGIFLVLAFAGVAAFVLFSDVSDPATVVPADAVNPVMSEDPGTGGAGTGAPAAGDGAGAGEGQPPGTDGN